jgi:hypothetical protein
MEQNRGPAAIVIARYGWKNGCAVKATHFCKVFASKIDI